MLYIWFLVAFSTSLQWSFTEYTSVRWLVFQVPSSRLPRDGSRHTMTFTKGDSLPFSFKNGTKDMVCKGQSIWEHLRCDIPLIPRSPSGPIIRINPDEIHISDPDFYDVAYASSAPFEKMPKWINRFGVPGAMFSTVQHELHRSRRMALNPYFSKKSISNFSWFIQHRMDQLCNRLLRECKGTGDVITLNDAWGAVAADVIINYCFESDYNFV